MTSSTARISFRLFGVIVTALALAGCETTGTGAPEVAAKPVEVPMTHTRAAEQCWMSTERGSAGLPLDKRADIVDKCIEQKMKAASGGAEPEPAPEAKKKKQASAAANAKKKKPEAAAGEKDKKPAATDAPDKKP